MLTRMQIVENVNHHVTNAITAITVLPILRKGAELNLLLGDASDRNRLGANDVCSATAIAGDPRSARPHWKSGMLLTPADTKQQMTHEE